MASRALTDTGGAGPIRFEYGGTKDLPDIMRIMNRSFSARYGESWNEFQCRSMLMLPGTHLLLAKDEQAVCGFAISRAMVGEEELLMIAVDPDVQKRNTGRLMLEQLINRSRSDGVNAVFLEVRSNNPAQNLYIKMGFEKIGERARYYTGADKTKYDAITYKLDIK